MNFLELLDKEEEQIILIIENFEKEQPPGILEATKNLYFKPNSSTNPSNANQVLSQKDSDFTRTPKLLNPGHCSPSVEMGLTFYDDMQIRVLACKTIKQTGII